MPFAVHLRVRACARARVRVQRELLAESKCSIRVETLSYCFVASNRVRVPSCSL